MALSMTIKKAHSQRGSLSVRTIRTQCVFVAQAVGKLAEQNSFVDSATPCFGDICHGELPNGQVEEHDSSGNQTECGHCL